jgi:hypothetical protein
LRDTVIGIHSLRLIPSLQWSAINETMSGNLATYRTATSRTSELEAGTYFDLFLALLVIVILLVFLLALLLLVFLLALLVLLLLHHLLGLIAILSHSLELAGLTSALDLLKAQREASFLQCVRSKILFTYQEQLNNRTRSVEQYYFFSQLI